MERVRAGLCSHALRKLRQGPSGLAASFLKLMKLGPVNGGESGIRTHDTLSRIHAFQACAFSHSAISPGKRSLLTVTYFSPFFRGARRPSGLLYFFAFWSNPLRGGSSHSHVPSLH